MAKLKQNAAASSPAAPAQAAPAGGPEKVKVGMFVDGITSVSMADNQFTADFYLWFKWKGSIDPSATYDLSNAINEWGMTVKPFYDEPTTLPSGEKYQGFRVQGAFVESWNFRDYPRTTLPLTIQIQDGRHSATELVYELSEGSGVGPRLENVLGGWSGSNASAVIGTETWNTNFGDPSAHQSDQYSTATFGVDISRSGTSRVAKLVVPIVIIMAITLLSFLLLPEQVDARLALTITALISAVLMHSDATDELPAVGYFVMIDKIYLLAYVIIFLTILESCVVYRLQLDGTEEEKRWALRADHISLAVLILLFLAGCAFFIFV